jgi:hypothetical protein
MGLLRANTSVKVGTLSARDGNRLPAGARDGQIPIANFMLKVDCEPEPCTLELESEAVASYPWIPAQSRDAASLCPSGAPSFLQSRL